VGLKLGDQVVVRTDRGVEAGSVVSMSGQMTAQEAEAIAKGEVLRKASAKDLERLREIEEELIPKERKFCEQKIKDHQLPMKLADVEHLLGGNKIIFYFLADGRVDFRELVKDLAREYQTRIEMRQIGVRDEAKLLADYGDCGKPVCCNTHLTEMPPVSMKMAKLQKATLDPTKISGRCGRLKCCLRFEYEMYEKMQKELPPLGSRVRIREGPARVVGHEILAGQLLVETDDRRRRLVPSAEVSVLDVSPPREAFPPETP